MSENVGIALGLVIGAGAATALGAAVVFFPAFVKHANRKTLASALGLSAGVMAYVSFVEIFQKSVASFEDANVTSAYAYATLCFFGGIASMMALNSGVTALLKGHHYHPTFDEKQKSQTHSVSNVSIYAKSDGQEQTEQQPTISPLCCSDDPVRDLNTLQKNGSEFEQQEDEQERVEDVEVEASSGDPDTSEAEDDHKLMRMSINTAVAIALHNFPEGLATFVATLNDPKVGAVLAIAVAIHNVPEGLCVAMPIYYATGKRWKAFGWGVLSGVSEPIAAMLGWAVLANSFSDITYAILFGLVAGMMVLISARELLPTAHRYDPEDTVTTNSFIVGMCVMALSLVMFTI